VPREWTDLFITDAPAAAPEPEEATPERRGGMFSRLRESLGKTRQAFSAELRSTLFDTLDDETWERLEELLIYADVGAKTTAKVVGQLEAEVEEGTVAGGDDIVARLEVLLAEVAEVGDPHIDLRH
jgi:fused signal recognition particle receptor